MSQMLMILRKAGVVQTERLGKEIFYSVDEEQLNKIYSAVRKFFGNGKK
jgi:DNA-binding transcriptional ArsR family regulator